MKVLGIHLLKGQIRYSLLEGTVEKPKLIAKDKVPVIDAESIPELMNWFESNFRETINQYKPDKIAYRLTLEPKKEQLINLEFPLGVLNLICYELDIETNYYTNRNYTAKRLGLDKDADIYDYCDETFGKHPPYWDKNQKNSILAAWFELD